MVLKPLPVPEGSRGQFENDVKMYGTQTLAIFSAPSLMFENDVKMYGTQTLGSGSVTWPMV